MGWEKLTSRQRLNWLPVRPTNHQTNKTKKFSSCTKHRRQGRDGREAGRDGGTALKYFLSQKCDSVSDCQKGYGQSDHEGLALELLFATNKLKTFYKSQYICGKYEIKRYTCVSWMRRPCGPCEASSQLPAPSFLYFISVPADWTDKLLPREMRIGITRSRLTGLGSPHQSSYKILSTRSHHKAQTSTQSC